MRKRHVLFPSIIGATAMAVMSLPATVLAEYAHPVNSGERSYIVHSEHFKSDKTRAQVVAEVNAASADGTLAILRVGSLPVPVKSSAKPLTRQEVVDAMRTESDSSKRARMELYQN